MYEYERDVVRKETESCEQSYSVAKEIKMIKKVLSHWQKASSDFWTIRAILC